MLNNPQLTSAHWRQEVYHLIVLKDAKNRGILNLQKELEDVTAKIHNADGRFTQAELWEQQALEDAKHNAALVKAVDVHPSAPIPKKVPALTQPKQ